MTTTNMLELGGNVKAKDNVMDLQKLVEPVLNMIINNKKNFLPISQAGDVIQKSVAAANQRNQEIKEHLKALQSEKEDLECVLKDMQAKALAFTEEKNEVTSQIAQVIRLKDKLGKEMENLQLTVNDKQERLRELAQEKETAHEEVSTSLPAIKKGFETLAMISHIKWDYTAPPDQVKGFVVRQKQHDVIPFQLDKNSNSQYFITNYLWQQIETDNPFM
ncbi:kinetochore protein spc24-like [Oratosquilla oratoria]|uniref:kinetochore protein spc24-like n=1 Tax=Oratosquilla oratoria TaxID=337810 RepID=UPI003F773A26